MSAELRAVLDACAGIRREGTPAALATVVCVEGSAYRRPGARMVVTGDGRTTGSLSGGSLERDVAERALRVMSRGNPELAGLQHRGRGRPRVGAAAEAFRSGCSPVIVVTGGHADRTCGEVCNLPVQVIDNPDWASGMSSSLRAGLTALETHDDRAAAALIAAHTSGVLRVPFPEGSIDIDTWEDYSGFNRRMEEQLR